MISLLIFCALFFHSQGAPQNFVPNGAQLSQTQQFSGQQFNQQSTPISIISQTESSGDNGTYNFSYETSNGIKVEESAYLKHITGLRERLQSNDPNQPDEADILARSGSFTYTAPDGTPITLQYTADENGFQPVGAHLPTPPPAPGSSRQPTQTSQSAGQSQFGFTQSNAQQFPQKNQFGFAQNGAPQFANQNQFGFTQTAAQ